MCNRAINKQMHPRNIFRQPPDYTELAIKYPEFRRVCKLVSRNKLSTNTSFFIGKNQPLTFCLKPQKKQKGIKWQSLY